MVPECSANFGPNCFKRVHEMAAILNRKNNIFAFFSQSALVISIKFGRDTARSKGHLAREIDLNNLDLGK